MAIMTRIGDAHGFGVRNEPMRWKCRVCGEVGYFSRHDIEAFAMDGEPLECPNDCEDPDTLFVVRPTGYLHPVGQCSNPECANNPGSGFDKPCQWCMDEEEHRQKNTDVAHKIVDFMSAIDEANDGMAEVAELEGGMFLASTDAPRKGGAQNVVDFEGASLDELRVLARSLWWLLDTLAMSSIIHRGYDESFRASADEVLKLRDKVGVGSNDGKTLYYDTLHHDMEETSMDYFMVRPDGDIYPDDAVAKRSVFMKEMKHENRLAGDCECESCKAVSLSMYRAFDALKVSASELRKTESIHADVMWRVMERAADALEKLASNSPETSIEASAEFAWIQNYLTNANTLRSAHGILGAVSRVGGPGRGMFLGATAIGPEDIAKMPAEIREKMREVLLKHGLNVPGELANDEDKKKFH